MVQVPSIYSHDADHLPTSLRHARSFCSIPVRSFHILRFDSRFHSFDRRSFLQRCSQRRSLPFRDWFSAQLDMCFKMTTQHRTSFRCSTSSRSASLPCSSITTDPSRLPIRHMATSIMLTSLLLRAVISSTRTMGPSIWALTARTLPLDVAVTQYASLQKPLTIRVSSSSTLRICRAVPAAPGQHFGWSVRIGRTAER